MENNELKDILLEEDDNKSKNIKKILIYTAVLVNIFLVIIVAMKFINTDDSSSPAPEADTSLVLPPMPTEQPSNVPQPTVSITPPPAQDPALPPQVVVNNNNANPFASSMNQNQNTLPPSEQVVVNNADEFEDMIKKLKEKENNKTTATAEQTIEYPGAQNVPAPINPNELDSNKNVAAQLASKPTISEKPAKTEPATNSKTPNKKVARGSIYVQVSAVSTFNPNSDLVKKLQARGYKYTTLKVGSMTKILVGPLNSNEAQNTLYNIRSDISPNAYIYKTK